MHAILLLLLFLVPLAAHANEKENSCVHVCAAVCTSHKTAQIAKFDCRVKPQHMCYKKYGKCERAANGKCAWRDSAELFKCVDARVGEATKQVMEGK